MANEEHVKILRQGVKAWNKWREENPDVMIDLREAVLPQAILMRFDFGRADLVGACLWKTYLTEADLRSAKLVGADLKGADLGGADLVAADLVAADLMEANLRRANLRRANLVRANFSKSYLDNANFDNSCVGYTNFTDIDLSNTRGLESIDHQLPSSVGIDTIYKSKGNIPEVFLRGCGVPENFINYMPSLVGKGIEFYSCFISYSHVDKPFAQRLHNDLQARGIRCWLDEHQLLPGDSILDQIDRGIRLWDKVILICSKDSLTSPWVDRELDKAIQKEEKLWRQHGKKTLALIPIDLDGYVFEGWESSKASIVKERFIADCTGWNKDNEKYEKQVLKIVEALKTEDAGRPPTPGEVML